MHKVIKAHIFYAFNVFLNASLNKVIKVQIFYTFNVFFNVVWP